jgi:hypothetical protein
MPESIAQLITRIAAEEGVDPALAIAMARQESGLNPSAVGDQGHSVGLFQLNDQGMGYGMGQARYDPETNARTALRSLAQTIQKNPGVRDPGRLAAMSQRPADPNGYARSINAMLGGGQGTAHTGSAFNPNPIKPAFSPLAQGGTPMATMATMATMADDPIVTTLTSQRKAAQSRLDAAMSNLQAVRQNPTWAAGVPNKENPIWVSANDAVEAAQQAVTKAQADLDTIDQKLGQRQADLAKPGAQNSPDVKNFGSSTRPDWRQYNPSSGQWEPIQGTPTDLREPKDTAPRTFQGQDGREYVLSDDGKTATLVQGQGEKPVTYQTVTDPQSGNVWTYDASKGQLVTQLFSGKPPITPYQSGGKLTGVNTQTGERVYQTDLPQTPQTLSANGSVYPIDPTTGLPDVTRGVQLPTQPQFSDPVAQFQYEVQRRQAMAQQESDRLRQQAQTGVLSWDDARAQFGAWWQQNVAGPLAGYQAAAQRAQDQDQRQHWQDQQAYAQAQAAEQARADAANRQREQAAFTAGNAEVARWNQMAPNARSTQFVNEYAQAAQNLGTSNYRPVSAAAITAPAPIVPSGQAFQNGAARALAMISPTAAQQIGAPPPNYQQWDLQALLRSLPQYTFTPPASAPAPAPAPAGG